MKKLILQLLCFFILGCCAFAQTPQYLPYQAVARNSAGNLLQNQNVSLRFTVHDVNSSGTVLYQEKQSATTNNLGLFNVSVGAGTLVSGSFSGITWGNGSPKFMQVEIDPTGGTNYTDMGASQMMSVPYALYAGSSGSAPTTNTLGSATNTITSNVNGVTATAPAVNSVDNTSSANNLSTTVNGVAGTAVPIINSTSNAWTKSSGLSTTVNGVAGTAVAPATGTIAQVIGYDATGAPVYQDVSGILGNTTNTLSSATNTITSDINGVTSTAAAVNTVGNTSSANNLSTIVNSVAGTAVPIINSASNAWTKSSGLSTTINGVSGTAVSPASGTVAQVIGYDASGAPVYQVVSGILGNTTNTLSSSVNTISSDVNGVTSTAPAVNTVANSTSSNTLTTTVNGVAGSGVNIITGESASWTQLGGLSNTFNGQAATVTPAIGTVANVLGYSSTGAPVYQAITSLSGTTVSNASSTNTLTTTVDGVTGTGVNIINSHTLTQNGSNQLVSTVNGVVATALTTAITGDVTGNLGASTVGKIQGTPVTLSSLANGNLLQYSTAGTDWVNVTPATAANGAFILNQSTAQSSSNFNISGTGTIGGNATIGGSTLAFTNTGPTTITMPANSVTANYGAPAFGTSASPGEKICFYPAQSSTAVDYSMGIASGELWFALPQANTSDQYAFYGGTTPLVTILGSGKVGIGTPSPNDLLEVAGVTRAQGYRCLNGVGGNSFGNVFNFYWNGSSEEAWIDGSEISGSISDRRLKENILNMHDNAIDRMMALRPVSFKFKKIDGTIFTGSDIPQEGFIADEVQTVIPSAVKGKKDGLTSKGTIQPQSLNVIPIVSVVTKAVQEQQNLIEKQAMEIEQLKNDNASLKSGKADAVEMQELKLQLSELKALMAKNGIRGEK